MSVAHPLAGVGLTIRNFKCFGEEGGSFPVFQPINIIIGRNNSGKSALIDAVELCIKSGQTYDATKHARPGSAFAAHVSQNLDESSLQRIFREGYSGGGVPGSNHWDFGKQFVGATLRRSFGQGWKPKFEDGPDFSAIRGGDKEAYYRNLNEQVTPPFTDCQLLKILAERDVRPESRDGNRKLDSNGAGTTNLVRAFISSVDLPREEVERGLLADLNAVYQGDCEFTEIICQVDSNEIWELYLREDTKGDVRLSESGSSLKSIFIMLCMLRLWPIIQRFNWDKIILAIEEPENNLHPALLRRLLDFLANQREEKRFALIITTHSPICIDWSAKRSDCQIIHVQHDGGAARSRTAMDYRASREILEDLDIRASDILQANGVIWVEGPSDRIYLRRWLNLASDGKLKEGVHYTIMFYGGKLLSHLDALPPGKSEALISLLEINRNAAILIDSDRRPGGSGGRKPRMNLNATKQRIKKELEDIGGFVWVTEGREIENYTPIEVFARIAGKRAPKEDSYRQIVKLPMLKGFKENKVSIAHAAALDTKQSDLVGHLDIWAKLKDLCAQIECWNG